MLTPEHAQDSKAASGAAQMLLAFLREHDAACPVCGYNLRALTRPVCPECGHELVLTVGAARVRLGWLMAAVAPGFFSGIAAVFLLVPVVGRLIWGDGRMSPALNALVVFGLGSGGFAIYLARTRSRFLAQPRARQRWWTLGIWLVHVAALGLLIVLGPRYL
ncbi:MAG TPA: hypothetical protein VGN72_06195 [Tepidisphaeraceae bacterium]|jgi:hypothetical protein|nr:hypothetical protein [Tepidisphaeraceae bacterium]